jgi:four helix bundle protein
MNSTNPRATTDGGQRISAFQDLRVYQGACALDEAVFHETKKWPKEEKFALIDQIRRSSRSIGANIAESWAKRRYPAHFVSKLTDSDGELQETEHWLGRALAYGYLRDDDFALLMARCKSIGRQIGRMIHNPDSFCESPASGVQPPASNT